MNQIEIILQKIADITKWMNTITNNSKKIEELPALTEVLGNAKLAVSVAGEAKSMDLDKIIGLQNNVGRTISLGYTTGEITVSLVVGKMNARSIKISEKETPVFVSIGDLPILTEGNGFQSFQSSKKYTFLFKPGKGNYGMGLNYTTVTPSMLTMVSLLNLTNDDVAIDPNSSIQPLGEVADGNFIEVANQSVWELTNENLNYYFSFERDGVLYIAYFKGEPGNYGQGQTMFTEDDFIITTNSNIVPQILRTDQLENTGEDGTSPFATVAQVNGLKIIVNQSSAEMYLRDASGSTLATVNLAFLNNEGTTFFYDAASGNLQLKNDAGEILSDVPVSAFVTNLIQYADFNASIPQRLEFKGPSGSVIDYVTLTINNVESLQTALNIKANKDGSNATGVNWAISILGNAATATQAANATNWGGKPADFTYEGSDQSTVLGIDTSAIGRRYTKSSFKLWLAMAMTDVAGLVDAFAAIGTTLAGKANKDGSNATGEWLGIVSNTSLKLRDYLNSSNIYLGWTGSNLSLKIDSTDFGATFPINAVNANGLGGYQYSDTTVNAANVGNFLIRRPNNLEWVIATPATVAQALGVTSKANNNEVIHTSGNEERTGSLTNLGIVRIGTGSVNSGKTRARIVNDSGKVWALVSGQEGVNENYFTLVNETDGNTPLIVLPNGNTYLNGYLNATGVLIPNGAAYGFTGASAGTSFAASSENLLFYTNNVERARITPEGYLRVENAPVHDKDAVRKVDFLAERATIYTGRTGLININVPANGSTLINIAVTGADTTDFVSLSIPASSTGLVFQPFISSANTVTVRVENVRATPANLLDVEIKARIIKFPYS